MTTGSRIIPTRYDGILYRSRTEARWAVFLDAIGTSHHYEPDGFDFGDIRYLPDFYLPATDLYVEIKGSVPTPDERRKTMLLSAATHSRVVVFSGPPEPRQDDSEHVMLWQDGRYSGHATLAFCEPCGRIGVHAGGWDDRCGCRARLQWNHPKLVMGAERARSHRFETPVRVPEIITAYDHVAVRIGVEGCSLAPDAAQIVLAEAGFDIDSPVVQQAILDHCEAPRSVP